MNYIKIEFNNACATEYDYTICPWNELADQCMIAESNITESDNMFWEKEGVPTITITPVDMTERQYQKWFAKNVKP